MALGKVRRLLGLRQGKLTWDHRQVRRLAGQIFNIAQKVRCIAWLSFPDEHRVSILSMILEFFEYVAHLKLTSFTLKPMHRQSFAGSAIAAMNTQKRQYSMG